MGPGTYVIQLRAGTCRRAQHTAQAADLRSPRLQLRCVHACSALGPVRLLEGHLIARGLAVDGAGRGANSGAAGVAERDCAGLNSVPNDEPAASARHRTMQQSLMVLQLGRTQGVEPVQGCGAGTDRLF